jgi:methionyl-tRNA formyltransferase
VAATRVVCVPREADAGEAYAALAPVAVEALQATLTAVEDGTVVWEEQRGEPTYAAKIAPDERLLDWTRGAREIVDRVRALAPHVGAVTELLGERTRIWRASPAPGAEAGPPGAPVVLDGDRLLFGAGDGAVEVLALQRAGGRRMSAAEFLRGAGRALAAR